MSNDTYDLKPGQPLYVGCFPDVVAPAPAPSPGVFVRPAPGKFRNISVNTLLSVAPPGWGNSDITGPFSNWGGGVLIKDFSKDGALAYHASGHLGEGVPLWAGVGILDLTTLAFSMVNVPPAPLISHAANGGFNQHGESTDPKTEKHTTPPHTYGGLVERSKAHGGGPRGSMVRMSIAGQGLIAAAHEFDLSPSAPAKRVIDDLGGTTYPCAAVSEDGAYVYYLSANGNGPLKRFGYDDNYAEIEYPGVEFNEYGDFSMKVMPGAKPCLVATGRSGSGGVDMAIYVAPIVGGKPQPFVKVSATGERPLDARCGLQWSTILKCFVAYEAAGSYRVHRLTPPADGMITTSPWTWSFETVASEDGSVPSRSKNNDNGAWARFIELPEKRCFAWLDSVSDKQQAFTLQGM